MRQRRSINPHPNGRPEPGASHRLAVATALVLSAVGCAPPHGAAAPFFPQPLVAIRSLSRPGIDIDPLIGPECPLLFPTRAADRFAPGDRILASAFGGGLAWGSALLRKR